MSAPRVVISYRREDAAGYAGRLYDHLVAALGSHRVFMDIDAIEPGDDFVEAIEQAVDRADVLLAVIGRSWVSVADESGRRRLDDPQDFVTLEVATALDRGIRVIPILVGGATMPQETELPEALAGLRRRQALTLTHDSFNLGVQRLRRTLDSTAAGRREPVSAEPSEATPEPSESTQPGPAPERNPAAAPAPSGAAEVPADTPTVPPPVPPSSAAPSGQSDPLPASQHTDPRSEEPSSRERAKPEAMPRKSQRLPARERWLMAAMVAIALVIVVMVVVAIRQSAMRSQRSSGGEDSAAVARQSEWEWLQSAKAELDRNRGRLELATIASVGDGPDEDDDELRRLREATTELTEEFNRRLVAFINVMGLIDGQPRTARQRQAIHMKSDEDILIAREYIDQGGEYSRAIQILEAAQQLDPDYQPLQEALTEARANRYMTADRFAAVEVGMDEEQVRTAIGPPSSRNIKEYPDQGRTGWFYPTGPEQGAAGVFFHKKDGELVVYAADFTAVGPNR